MSFSSSVKNEVAKKKVDDICDVIAELCGLVPTCGSLKFNSSGVTIYFNTENAAVARRIFTFLKGYYSEEVEVMVSKSRQLKKKNVYSISLKDSGAAKVLLYDIDFIKGENVFLINYKPENIITNTCCKKAYIRGAFLGSGSVTNPERSYHLEFVCENFEHAQFLSEVINSFLLNSKIVRRKESYIVYLKEAEQISDLLAIIGATKSLLDFENVRVFKALNNQVNRIVNLETANMNKTIDASLSQIEDIEFINRTIGLDKLPENLQEVAKIRLENDSISLKEIGEKLNPPIGKSGVNHRLKKIKDIANKLRSE
ncbi:DNA-binding protein WhiA [Anaerosphaera multitolerans]|uniref:Probable cell division protein WhiA n=1 Tax=Anaerosphaera multitolerans TaxID=2487351 RepID=A0A437S841_9FIRM|nr:DNA-binding protein WhiA [Anaerosphaera multitolerans]RVU55084.1 DNA-binding protein WhiA [Anaerosphaera multitolerans]